jgi:RimJ/RimL family protein N-acetyltransferase
VIGYGFRELKFERIEASMDAANLASTRIMEKVGMHFWKREPTNGLDTVYYALSREAFDPTQVQPHHLAVYRSEI